MSIDDDYKNIKLNDNAGNLRNWLAVDEIEAIYDAIDISEPERSKDEKRT